MPGIERAQHLLDRLDEIGLSLERTGHALALLGLGSVGEQLQRLDEYSDLDFFAIVRPGSKSRFVDDLAWLAEVHPIAYSFKNTRDGHKVLFADDIYAEFAIFTPDELPAISANRHRVVWQDATFDPAAIQFRPPSPPEPHSVQWLVGEILTNLYVGLCRYHRGERLSAARLIQVHAVDRLIELAPHFEHPAQATGTADPFAPERRFESRFPHIAAALPQFVQGYDRGVDSALAILRYIEQRTTVPTAIKQHIIDLCDSER